MIKIVFDCTAAFKASLGYVIHFSKMLFNSSLCSWYKLGSLPCTTWLYILGTYPFCHGTSSFWAFLHIHTFQQDIHVLVVDSLCLQVLYSKWFSSLSHCPLSSSTISNIQSVNSLPFQIFVQISSFHETILTNVYKCYLSHILLFYS